jgi:hypothetical protein
MLIAYCFVFAGIAPSHVLDYNLGTVGHGSIGRYVGPYTDRARKDLISSASCVGVDDPMARTRREMQNDGLWIIQSDRQ